MQEDAFNSAAERINAGEEIPKVDPCLIEQYWVAVSSIPRSQHEHVAIGIGAFAHCDPNALKTPEQQFAMLARYALMDALVEQGVLDEYMKEESQRKRVFVAAASVPCDKNDLGEALAERSLRDSNPEQMEVIREQLAKSGYDRDHLKVAEKFVAWIRDNC